MDHPITVLLVEDNPGDARLILETLREMGGGPCNVETVDRVGTALERLRKGGIDVVLLDLALPDSQGPETFTTVYRHATGVPIIVLTGLGDMSVGLRMVRSGAQDYLIKGQVEGNLLGRALRYAIKRNRSEVALRRSEARFRCLFDSNTIGFIITDTEGRIFEANDAFLQMIGRTRNELTAGEVRWDTLTPPEHAELDRQAIKALAQQGTAGPYEKEYLHSDGHRVPVQLGVARVPEAPGECICYVVDLTERDRAAESIQWLTKAVQQSPASVLITDTRGRIEYVNRRFSEDTGYALTEVMGRTPAILKSGETSQQIYEELWKTITGGGEWRGELLNCKKNRERFWTQASISPLRNSKGVITHFLGVQQDITERKYAEAQIRGLNENLERRVRERTSELAAANTELSRRGRELQEYIDAMSTMNAKVAPDGSILLVNQIAQQASGLPLQSLINTSFLEGRWWTFDPEVRSRVGAAFEEACSGTPVSYEEQIFVFGKVVTVNFTLVPIPGPEGPVDYIVAEARDISRRVEAEERLRAANQELEAFTYSVSHDLRAPLRHVDGFCRLLAEYVGPSLDPQARHYLRRIQEGTQHMGRLVDDLLHLAQVGRQDVRSQTVALDAIVKDVIGELRADVGDRNVRWEVGQLPTVECDPGLMKIVFTNLLSNAIKYTQPRDPAVIEVGSARSNGRSTLFIRDNGVGFNMKYADKLFGVFQRLHRADQFEGTGVGLATVQRIIHKHGGEIWAEAEPDKGAAFFFTIASASSVAPAHPA